MNTSNNIQGRVHILYSRIRTGRKQLHACCAMSNHVCPAWKKYIADVFCDACMEGWKHGLSPFIWNVIVQLSVQTASIFPSCFCFAITVGMALIATGTKLFQKEQVIIATCIMQTISATRAHEAPLEGDWFRSKIAFGGLRGPHPVGPQPKKSPWMESNINRWESMRHTDPGGDQGAQAWI